MGCIYQVVGRKDSGKTLAVELAVKELKSRGYVVAVVKHTHHVINPPSKDTARFMASGAAIVILHSNDCSLFWSCEEPDYLGLIPADVIIVEGFADRDLGRKFSIESPSEAPAVAQEMIKMAEGCMDQVELQVEGAEVDRSKKLIFSKLMKRWGIKEVKLLEG